MTDGGAAADSSAPVMRPRAWPVFVAFATTVVLQAPLLLAVLLVLATTHPDGLRSLANPVVMQGLLTTGPGLVAAAAVSAVSLGATAVVFARLERLPLRPRLRLVSAPVRSFVAAPLALLGASEALTAGAVLLGWEPSGTLAVLSQVIAGMSVPVLVVALVVIAGAAGIAEELFFRGYAQGALCPRFGRWRGIATASALFAFLHLDLEHSALAFVMGLLIGWMAEKTGSVLPVALAHVVNNAVYVVTVRAHPEPWSRGTNALLCAGGLAMLAAGVVVLARRRP